MRQAKCLFLSKVTSAQAKKKEEENLRKEFVQEQGIESLKLKVMEGGLSIIKRI